MKLLRNALKGIAPALLLLGAVSPALAGEVGVTNSWGSSYRHGAASYHLTSVTNRHESGEVYTSAFKKEVGTLPPYEGQHMPSGVYTASSSANGSMKYREDTKTTFGEKGHFVFGSSEFSHSVSAFGY